ncbi:hypothetical protein U1Q18_049320 [Sarracenia purpurea var. burkii]
MIRVFQFFTVLPGFILLSAAATFMLTVIIETHNKFVTASANLRCISERTIEEMHKMDLEEEKALTKCRTVCLEIVMRLDEEREILMDTFYVDFVQSLKRYQQLRRMNDFCKTVYETNFSIGYFRTMFVMTIMGFLFAHYWSLGIETELALSAAGNTVAMFLILFGCCIIGNMFIDMNEEFGEEVYAMPWYHLNPKYRKTCLHV